MPLHALTLPWDKFRGAVRSSDPIGGMVLYDSPHVGCVSRQFVIPANPRTTLQTQQRGRLATSAKGWVDLDADTAAAWRALARQLTRSNALGFTYVLTGIGLFNMVNTYRLIAGLPVDDSTPDIARIPVPPPVDPLAWSNGTTLIVDLPSHGNDATIHALVRVTNSIATAARLLRPCELRIPTANTVDSGMDVDPAAANLECEPDAVTILGGEWIGCEIVLMSADYLPRAPIWIPHLLAVAF